MDTTNQEDASMETISEMFRLGCDVNAFNAAPLLKRVALEKVLDERLYADDPVESAARVAFWSRVFNETATDAEIAMACRVAGL
jgi:hypothetical protein